MHPCVVRAGKFKVYPPGSLFVSLKQLLDDFAHHNIDAACALVETAGRYLFRTPETKIRMENMLEVCAWKLHIRVVYS